MTDPTVIMARVRSYGANLMIDAGKLRIVNARRLPNGAEAYIRQHYMDLFDLLKDEGDEVDERAAIVEFDANAPRAIAEQFARLCVDARRDPSTEVLLIETCGRIIDETFGRAA